MSDLIRFCMESTLQSQHNFQFFVDSAGILLRKLSRACIQLRVHGCSAQSVWIGLFVSSETFTLLSFLRDFSTELPTFLLYFTVSRNF